MMENPVNGSAFDVAGAAAELLKSKPEAREHAIEADRGRDLLDRYGLRFDPKIHAVNKDGAPSRNPKGGWRKRREFDEPTQPDPEQIERATTAAGATAAGLLFTLATMALGEEWIPSEGEQEAVTGATINYFAANNWGDMPPGAILCTVLLSYAIPRLQMPDLGQVGSGLRLDDSSTIW